MCVSSTRRTTKTPRHQVEYEFLGALVSWWFLLQGGPRPQRRRMTFASDDAIDRRRLRRRLSAWRAVAIMAVAVAIGIVVVKATGGATGKHIARVAIKGAISEDLDRDKTI